MARAILLAAASLLFCACSGEPFTTAELDDTEPDAAPDAADASGALDAPSAGGSSGAGDATADASGSSGAGGSTIADATSEPACELEQMEQCGLECPPGWTLSFTVFVSSCGPCCDHNRVVCKRCAPE